MQWYDSTIFLVVLPYLVSQIGQNGVTVLHFAIYFPPAT